MKSQKIIQIVTTSGFEVNGQGWMPTVIALTEEGKIFAHTIGADDEAWVQLPPLIPDNVWMQKLN